MNNFLNIIGIISIFFMLSCGHDTDLSIENRQLQHENDSLKKIVDSLHILPFIDNTLFETTVGEAYRMHLLGVLKDEIYVQELFINGQKVNLEANTNILEYDEYGAFITFRADSVGMYNFKAKVTFQHWGDRIVPLSWPIEVKEK